MAKYRLLKTTRVPGLVKMKAGASLPTGLSCPILQLDLILHEWIPGGLAVPSVLFLVLVSRTLRLVVPSSRLRRSVHLILVGILKLVRLLRPHIMAPLTGMPCLPAIYATSSSPSRSQKRTDWRWHCQSAHSGGCAPGKPAAQAASRARCSRHHSSMAFLARRRPPPV